MSIEKGTMMGLALKKKRQECEWKQWLSNLKEKYEADDHSAYRWFLPEVAYTDQMSMVP